MNKKNLYPLGYLAPGLLALALCTFIPAGLSIYISFTNYSLVHLQDWGWVGLQNYERIFTGLLQGDFWRVLAWTFAWAFLSTLLSFLIGLFLALILNDKRIVESNVYRTILILPWALPSTITILAWAGLFSTSFGPINRLIISLGGEAVPWLTEPGWARFTCLLVNLWIAFPFMMAACLGALQSVPAELYDAAQVDGAGKYQTFRFITLPLLRMAVVPLLVAGFAMQFSNFSVIYLMTNGGPFVDVNSVAGATDLLATYMYRVAFASTLNDYGIAAANGMLLFLIVGTITVINARLTGAFKQADEL